MSEARSTGATTARRLTILTAILLLVGGLAVVADAGVGSYTCSDPSKVYYGNHRLFQRPAHVDCDQVYGRIDEYQEIVRRRLTDKDAQYHILLKKASKRFSEAVKKMARDKQHDLVAQDGAVAKAKTKAKDIPDRTQDVIQALD